MDMERRMRAWCGMLAGMAAMLAVAGPAAAFDGGTPAPEGDGGVEFSAPLGPAAASPPVATVFRVRPAVVTSPQLPRLTVRIDQPGASAVRAAVVLVRRGRQAATVRARLGQLPAGRRLAVGWPRRLRVSPGRYRVRLDVTGLGGVPLARAAQASGRATLLVRAPAPKPAPPPAPAPAPVAAAPAPAPDSSGVFPVAGPHTYGDGIGAPRSGHTHQGQDILAAEGLPVVAPVAGTVLYVSYQAAGAGYYVVEHTNDGRDFFFAHCQAGSVVVGPGQVVVAGQRLCSVGHTGSATGPHLHFEIWLGGWRVNAASYFIDPLPTLQAWDR
jgi:murein DD-endopeptidase MepM/ murein hydrolase activator NlpD